MPAIDRAIQQDGLAPIRVLITGFGPFLQHETNPSWEASKSLNGATSLVPAEGESKALEITCVELEVSYREACAVVPQLHGLLDTSDGPATSDLFLHIGVGRPGRFALETQAHRWGYDRACDIRGQHAPLDPRCELHGLAGEEWDDVEVDQPSSDEYTKSDIDVARLKEWMAERTEAAVELSSDPGNYICDFVYGISMRCAQRRAKLRREVAKPVLFLHVPIVDERHSLESMTVFIRLLLFALVNGDFVKSSRPTVSSDVRRAAGR